MKKKGSDWRILRHGPRPPRSTTGASDEREGGGPVCARSSRLLPPFLISQGKLIGQQLRPPQQPHLRPPPHSQTHRRRCLSAFRSFSSPPFPYESPASPPVAHFLPYGNTTHRPVVLSRLHADIDLQPIFIPVLFQEFG